MTQQTLTNGESLLNHRTKLNANFTELYATSGVDWDALPTTEPAEAGLPWQDENGFVKVSTGATNRYQVRGFTDADYFGGPAGSGLATIGTVRFIGKLLSVPVSGQKIIVGRSSGGTGWYIATGLTGAGTLDIVGSAASYGLAATFGAGDVGKVFCVHTVIVGGELITYFGGIEVHRIAVTPTAADSGTAFTVGRFGPATSYSNPYLSVIDLATSNTAMTSAEIFSDAVQVQSRTANFRILDIPNQLHRFNADAVATTTNWVSSTGSLTLTRNGTLTVELY